MSEICLEEGTKVLLSPDCNRLFRPDSPSNPRGIIGQIIKELDDAEDEYDFLVQWANGVQNEYNYCELIPFEAPVIKCIVETDSQKIEFDSIEKAKEYCNALYEVPLKYFVAENTQKSFNYMGCQFKVCSDSNYRYVATDYNGYIYVYDEEPLWNEKWSHWDADEDNNTEEVGVINNNSFFTNAHSHKSLQEIKYND